MKLDRRYNITLLISFTGIALLVCGLFVWQMQRQVEDEWLVIESQLNRQQQQIEALLRASTFGPSVLINNVSIPVGPTGPANLVVTGIVGAYKAITGKTRAEIEGLKATIEGLKASQQLAVQDREVWESRYEALSVKYQSLQSQHDELMGQVRLLLVRTAPGITPLPPIPTPAGR